MPWRLSPIARPGWARRASARTRRNSIRLYTVVARPVATERPIIHGAHEPNWSGQKYQPAATSPALMTVETARETSMPRARRTRLATRSGR